MSASFSPDVLRLDTSKEILRIASEIRRQVIERLNRRGVVVALSGGVDSSVTAALSVQALGPDRVVGLCLPERESSAESLSLARLVADALGIRVVVEDLTLLLDAAGCYRRRDEAIRALIPEYGEGYKCKIALDPAVTAYAVYAVVARSLCGVETKVRLTADALLQIVAATNFKQRTRKMMEYYYADRLHFAVAGTPNLLEYDQGFFVKNGDGSADLKPIAHLYKCQVYQLAVALKIPEEIRRRPPTTDTYSMEQSQSEFFFRLPLETTDLCLYGKNNGIPAAELAPAVGLTAEEVTRVYREFDSKRAATHYLHSPPLLVEPA